MADQLLSALFADGCSVDGATSSSNPIAAILNAVIDSSAIFSPISGDGGPDSQALEGPSHFVFEQRQGGNGHMMMGNMNHQMQQMQQMQQNSGGTALPLMMGMGGMMPGFPGHMPMMSPMMMSPMMMSPMMMMGQSGQMQYMQNREQDSDNQYYNQQQHQQYHQHQQEEQQDRLGEGDFFDESEENVEAMFEEFYANLHRDSAQYAGNLGSISSLDSLGRGEVTAAGNRTTSSSNSKSAWDSLADNLEKVGSGQEVYEFSRQNPLMTDANRDLQRESNNSHYFDLGLQYFKEGDITKAIHAFEAHVQEDTEHSEAWRMLGTCYAEHDQDKVAIVCLKKSIENDPFNLDTLLSLGISFVNELDSVNALQTLRSWVLHNPSFQGLTVELDAFSDGSLMDEVTQLMLEVQRLAPADTDVKIILGVLYNVSQDYDLAAQLFNEALLTRPDDYSLHNKVGATLANGNRSSVALPVYTKALTLRPSYARGWLNLGIAYANLSRYEDASKAYIQALHLNPNAKHIWGYLRVVLTCMDRLELVELTTREDLVSLAAAVGMELK